MLLIREKQNPCSSPGGRLHKALSTRYSFRTLGFCQLFIFQHGVKQPVRETSQNDCVWQNMAEYGRAEVLC